VEKIEMRKEVAQRMNETIVENIRMIDQRRRITVKKEILIILGTKIGERRNLGRNVKQMITVLHPKE